MSDKHITYTQERIEEARDRAAMAAMVDIDSFLLALDDIERLASRRAVKLCPECERETEHTKYCEVWECSVCGCDSEQNFAKLEGGAQ